MASGSSGSSYSSFSARYPPTYRQAQTSPLDSTWTAPTSQGSTVSALTSQGSVPSALTSHSFEAPTPLRPLDLGPPGYYATITLFEHTPDPITVFLGPWEIESAGLDCRRLVWQGSYQGEVLEHYLPSGNPAQTFPHTQHALHRRFQDPRELEFFITFTEPQRVRYVAGDGSVRHDAMIDVKYVFATFDGSLRFQGDLRNKELIDFFDVDVVWSDRHGRTDSFGAVKGIATGQRMKLWKDKYSSRHSISFLGRDGWFHEYPVSAFLKEVQSQDNRHRRLRLNVPERRGSAQDSSPTSRRLSLTSMRIRGRSVDDSADSTASSSHQWEQASSSAPSSHGRRIHYLAIQFTRSADFDRFIVQWNVSHAEDSSFNGVPFPLYHVELSSGEPTLVDPVELSAVQYSMLDTVAEPANGE